PALLDAGDDHLCRVVELAVAIVLVEQKFLAAARSRKRRDDPYHLPPTLDLNTPQVFQERDGSAKEPG
ncbi:hypothetical protein, partial [Pseudomonas aeruginosa]|uniref:hypothetical protein n=1 Tax=Pseudomonas aeruginosa TaxID=287 RepID=UPI001F4AC792